jgi:DNA-binding response OmpR family regulator
MLADLRILFVDDAPDEAEMYRVAFALDGAEVVCAESVDEALEAVARSSFDVVVSDVFLYGRSGLELARELRAAGVTTPAIALTGADARLLGPEAHEAGFDAYCAKPCLPTQLAAVIVGLLRRAQAAAAGTRRPAR